MDPPDRPLQQQRLERLQQEAAILAHMQVSVPLATAILDDEIARTRAALMSHPQSPAPGATRPSGHARDPAPPFGDRTGVALASSAAAAAAAGASAADFARSQHGHAAGHASTVGAQGSRHQPSFPQSHPHHPLPGQHQKQHYELHHQNPLHSNGIAGHSHGHGHGYGHGHHGAASSGAATGGPHFGSIGAGHAVGRNGQGASLANVPNPTSGIGGRKRIRLKVPAEKYPEYNFVGRLLGPRGATLKKLERDTGCKIMIRGRGSIRKDKEADVRGKPGWEHVFNENLHVVIEVSDAPDEQYAYRALTLAKEAVELLLVPVPEEKDSLKRQQLRDLAILNGTFRPSDPSPSPPPPPSPAFSADPSISAGWMAAGGDPQVSMAPVVSAAGPVSVGAPSPASASTPTSSHVGSTLTPSSLGAASVPGSGQIPNSGQPPPLSPALRTASLASRGGRVSDGLAISGAPRIPSLDIEAMSESFLASPPAISGTLPARSPTLVDPEMYPFPSTPSLVTGEITSNPSVSGGVGAASSSGSNVAYGSPIWSPMHTAPAVPPPLPSPLQGSSSTAGVSRFAIGQLGTSQYQPGEAPSTAAASSGSTVGTQREPPPPPASPLLGRGHVLQQLDRDARQDQHQGQSQNHPQPNHFQQPNPHNQQQAYYLRQGEQVDERQMHQQRQEQSQSMPRNPPTYPPSRDSATPPRRSPSPSISSTASLTLQFPNFRLSDSPRVHEHASEQLPSQLRGSTPPARDGSPALSRSPTPPEPRASVVQAESNSEGTKGAELGSYQMFPEKSSAALRSGRP